METGKLSFFLFVFWYRLFVIRNQLGYSVTQHRIYQKTVE